jgi:hypothetical protein
MRALQENIFETISNDVEGAGKKLSKEIWTHDAKQPGRQEYAIKFR